MIIDKIKRQTRINYWHGPQLRISS